MPKYGGQNKIQFGVHFNADKASLQDVKKALQDIQNIKPANFSGTKSDLMDIKRQALKVEDALERAFNPKLNSTNIQTFNQVLRSSGSSIDIVYQKFSKLGPEGQVAFSKMASSVLTTNIQLKQTHSLLQSMGTTMMNTVKWGIASSIFNNITQSVSQAFDYVKALDSALTDIRIVTGDSRDEMSRFADQANRAAQSLGRSTMEYSKAALTFYQQGLNDEEVQARTQAVLKAQNITGAGSQMADYLTAVWNGYKVANEEAELYVDKLAAVADSSASNMSQLAIAMSKVASSANMLGVPVDSLNAQIATIVATTRNAPESVGNALKTIYARINDISTGAEDAEISLGNYSSKMMDVGISVLDANGNLRDTGDVIDEIGGKWETLSREQQIYLARTMAGQRQYNNLLALFDNWGKYTDLLNVSMDAQGTTMEKNSRYMESLEAHLNQLGAASERVKKSLIDTDSFKGLVDIGTGLTNAFGQFMQSIGGGGNALLLLGGTLTSLFSGTIGKEINSWVVNFQNIKENARLVNLELKNTEDFGKSLGYQDDAIRQMVDQKKAVIQIYGQLSKDQKQEYNAALQNIGAAKQQLILAQAQEKTANEYIQAFAQINVSGKDFQNRLQQISERANNLQQTLNEAGSFNLTVADKGDQEVVIENLKNAVDSLKESMTAQDSTIFGEQFQVLEKHLENIKAGTPGATEAIRACVAEAQELLNKVNEGNSSAQAIDDIKLKVAAATVELEQAKTAANNLLASFNQEFVITGIVDTIGAAGRLSGALLSVKSAINGLFDKSLPPGEKFLRLLISLGSAGPIAWQAFNKLKSSTLSLSQALINKKKIQQAVQKADQVEIALSKEKVVTSQAEAAAEKKQAVAETESAIASEAQATATGKQVIAEGADTAATIANTGAKVANTATTNALTTAQIALNNAIKANPIGLAITAIMAAVTVFSLFASKTKDAEQAIDKFNEKQKQLNQNIKNYNSGATQLEQVANEYEILAKKAGAINFDNTIDNLTERERERYNQIKNLIAQYNEDAIIGYNEQGQAILNNNTLLQYQIQLIKQKKREQIDDTYNSEEFSDAQDARRDKYEEAKKNRKNLQSNRSDYNQYGLSNAINDIRTQISLSEYSQDYQQYVNQLDAILSQGAEVVSQRGNQILEIQKNIFAKAEENKDYALGSFDNQGNWVDFTSISDTISAVLNTAQYYDSQLLKANNEIKNTIEYSKTDILNLLQNSENYQQYEAMASQYGEEFLRSIIIGYVDGAKLNLENTDDIFGAVDAIKTDLFGSLTSLNITGKDIEKYQEQAKTTLSEIDLNETTVASYHEIIKKSIADLYNDPKLQQLAVENKQAFEALIQSTFGLNDVEFYIDHRDGKLIPVIQDQYTKLLSQAKSEAQLTFKEHGIQKVPIAIEGIIDATDINDLNLVPQALERIDWETKDLTEDADALKEAYENAFLQAKQFNNMTSSVSATSLLQKQASGESLSDDETAQLQQDLAKLQAAFPELQAQIQIVTSSWLEGTKIYQAALENITQHTLESVQQMKEAGALTLEDAAAEVMPLITNTEVLQAAHEKGLLSVDNYYTSLEKLASQYETCIDELDRYERAVRAGTEAEIQNAEASLLLATRAAQLAEASGINAEQIQKTAIWLSQSNPALKENAELAADAAQRYIRLNNAMTDLYDNGDKYRELLAQISQSGGDAIYTNEDLFNSFNQMKGVVADLFDTSSDLLGDDWIVDHMNEILQAAETGGEGLEELKRAASEEILVNTGIDFSGFQMGKEEALNKIAEMEEGQALDIVGQADIEILTFIQQLVTAMQQAGFAQSEIEDALSGLGLDVDLAPYEAGLNKAIDDAGIAGQSASDYFAKNAGVNTKITTQTDEVSAENVIPGEKYNVTYAEGNYEYPDIEFGTGDLGPSIVGVTPRSFKIRYPQFIPEATTEKVESTTQATGMGLEVIGAHASSGGKISSYNKPGNRTSRKARNSKPSGGGGKGGGKSSTPKTGTKIQNKLDTKSKEKIYNPYEQVDKELERQEKQLKTLQDLEKQTVGKDRLENLKKQNQVLDAQNKKLRERQKISQDNSNKAKGSTAWYRRQIEEDPVFSTIQSGPNKGKQAKLFDDDGQIYSEVELTNRAVTDYNRTVAAAKAEYQKVEDDYNSWLKNVYDKLSKEEQDRRETERKLREDRVKKAKETFEEQKKDAEELYKQRLDYVEGYKKAYQEDEKNHQEYIENLRQQIENGLENITIKVTLAVQTGDAYRDYLEFENKVIKKRDKDDITGNTDDTIKELMSYETQAREAKKALEDLDTILADVRKGGYTSNYQKYLNIDRSQWDKLSEEEKQNKRTEIEKLITDQITEQNKILMESLTKMQDGVNKVKELYLDALNDVNKKMEDQIKQYERVNSLIDHNVKLVDLIYGDKGYESLNKWYALQDQNNRNLLDSLIKQRDFWAQARENAKDEDAWKIANQNLNKTVDQINSKIENMIETLTKMFQNKLLAAVDRVNNKMTNGRGITYLDEEWDYMDKYDDYFLDTVESKLGTDEITRQYQKALDATAGNPKQYQKINGLMQDQLKILKEKDKLTQYDLDRAKAMLEVEQARMALEDARNNKTKMRLRRDSQGNYTYQYVADEEKLSDLEESLANAQQNLYNLDKEHYKQNLNTITDTWKEFLQKNNALAEEYAKAYAAGDEEEMQRILERRQLLMKNYIDMMNGLTQDNKYNIGYVMKSSFDALGIDISKYDDAERLALLKQILPIANSTAQILNDNIVAEGGFANAITSTVQSTWDAAKQYGNQIGEELDKAGSSVETVMQITNQYGEVLDNNINDANRLIQANQELIKSCKDEIAYMQTAMAELDKYINGAIKFEEFIATIRKAQNTIFEQNGSNLRVDKNVAIEENVIDPTINRSTDFSEESGKKAGQNLEKMQDTINGHANFIQDQIKSAWDQNNEKMKLVNKADFEEMIDAIAIEKTAEIVQNTIDRMTNNIGLNYLLDKIGSNADSIIKNTTNTGLQDIYNDINITASFPDATSSAEIEEAFRNLIAMAAMRAATKSQ